jgi:hypothetical protein
MFRRDWKTVVMLLAADVAAAERARGGPAVLVDGQPVSDDPAGDIPIKLVREGGAWRVENRRSYVPR